MNAFARFPVKLVLGAVVAVALGLTAPAALAGKGGKNNGGKPGASQAGLSTIKRNDWDETAVRKVLHVFAYGGFASDPQIADWAAMPPGKAIAEILTFDRANAKLSPPEDASADHADSLGALQRFWSSDDPANPVRRDRWINYVPRTGENENYSTSHLQNTWFQAVNTRGINPFLHMVAFYLSNHHMAIHIGKAGPLIRDYYDEILDALAAGDSMTDIQYLAASSAAVSRAYAHQYNTFINATGEFRGNDDFGREFHQLIFRIQGETEDYDYHENITIENTARMLTGMNIDRAYGAFEGSPTKIDYISPINFADHIDATDRNLRNTYYHHADCLEALHTTVCGIDAGAKLAALATVAGDHPEALANIPATLIGYIADDNLTPEKTSAIQAGWAAMGQKDLLSFLRSYAVSTAFHSTDTYKYATAFDRNIIVWNRNTLDNAGSHAHGQNARYPAQLQGAEVFEPAHDVFGAQTGLESANNPNLFLAAYNRRVRSGWNLYNAEEYVSDTNGLTEDWIKDWGSVAPATGGAFVVGDVAAWLWNRFVADGGKNFGPVERAHVQSLLATGRDFGWRMELVGGAPDRLQQYGAAELTDPGNPAYLVDHDHAATVMDLASPDVDTRRTWNRHVGYAVNFIAATPFVFAYEGK